jgi:ribosylpyrimidine nucleosidase
MPKRRIILDCDPGHDDAIALMLAGNHPDIELIGVTVVSGNQTLEKTAKNALNLCQYLNLDVPVCLGASTPIIKDVEVCAEIHGETGLDGFDFPKLNKTYDSKRAVDFIIDTILRSKEKITMVTTGPMTNLALAIRLEPRILENIDEVVLMGGSYSNGNVTPAAEFNIYSDPEAAYIVFNANVKVTMVGLDVTRKVLVLPKIVERMGQINNKASILFTKLMKVYNENQKKVFGLSGGPMHDPVTIAYLIDPSILTTKYTHCDIDISHESSYGRTNCDLFDYLHLQKNTYVGIDIDVSAFWNIIEEGIKRY